MRKIPVSICYLLSGICLSLPFFFSSWISVPLAYISGIPLLCLLFTDIQNRPIKKYPSYLYRGFFFGFGFHLGVYHWFIDMYPLDFIADLSPLQAVGVVCVAWFGLSLVATLCFGFIIPTFSLIANRPFVRQHALLLPLIFSSVFTVFSFLISLTWMGVPWGMVAITQTPCPALIATASLFGSYFITFVVITVNGYLSLFCTFLFCTHERSSLRTVSFPLILALSVFIVNLFSGVLLYNHQNKSTEHLTVALIQGNVSSREKWNGANESLRGHYDRLVRDFVEDAHAEGIQPDLVIWSETAIPLTLTNSDEPPSATVEWLSSLSKELNINNLVGAFSTQNNNGDEQDFNSLFLFRADGSQSDNIYHKRRPVPFGEFVPWEPFVTAVFPNMAKLAITSDLTAGTEANIFKEDFGNIGCLICFDSIYETLARDSVRQGAEVLVISTNDSWFDDSIAMNQHHAQAILRAVESGRYVVRAGNTGITSVISEKGDVISALDVSKEDCLLAEIPLYQHQTLYTTIGNSFLILLSAFLLSLPIIDIALIIRKKQPHDEK